MQVTGDHWAVAEAVMRPQAGCILGNRDQGTLDALGKKLLPQLS